MEHPKQTGEITTFVSNKSLFDVAPEDTSVLWAPASLPHVQEVACNANAAFSHLGMRFNTASGRHGSEPGAAQQCRQIISYRGLDANLQSL